MANRLTTKLQENSRGFWKDYRWLIVVFAIALFCDGASTIHFMLREGPEVEIHPAIRFISRILGPVAGPLAATIGKVAAGIIVGVYFRRLAGYIFVTASIISFWAGWYNIWGYRIYTPNILRWIPW